MPRSPSIDELGVQPDQPSPCAGACAQRLMAIVNGLALAECVCLAAELGIPDRLSSDSRRAAQLATEVLVPAATLYRLLRSLASVGICRHHADDGFSLTPTGRLLRSDDNDSLRSWTIWGVRRLGPLWRRLPYSVATGESARRLTLGTEGFDHLANDPAAAWLFDHAMAEVTRQVARGLLELHDFSSYQRVADIGGGLGELLATLLQAHPAMEGVLFDRPHALGSARKHLTSAGVISRCDLIAGDFFDSIPGGCSAYILKSVLHDWTDDQCGVVLRNLGDAMRPGARLLIVEQLMPERIEVSVAHQDAVRKDLSMLIGPGGRERTARQFAKMLEASNFRLHATRTAPLNFALMDASRA